LLVLVCAPLCLAWLLGDSSYTADLIAAFQMQITLLTLGLTAVLILTRRWRGGIVLLVLVLVSGWPLIVDRVWTLPGVDLDQKPDGRIRVVSLNINPKSESWEQDFDSLLNLDADVIVVIEVPPDLNRSIRRYSRMAESSYPYWVHRRWVDKETSPGFIISRWPIDPIETGLPPESDQHVLHAVVHHPSGDVVAGLLHPLSPRTKQRWMIGNGVIDIQRSAIEQTIRQSGLPMVMGVDLNSGPAQVRARTLKHSGLQMSKPLFRMGGSYPSNSSLPAVLRVQLDDVWHSPDLRAIAWSQMKTTGSDHTMVIADFVIR